MSKHLETETERIERIMNNKYFISGEMSFCVNDGITYESDTIMGISYEDLIFLLNKAVSAKLLEAELIARRTRDSEGYMFEQSEYIKYLEKENKILFKDYSRLRKELNELKQKANKENERD